jgi:hypothetical protein
VGGVGVGHWGNSDHAGIAPEGSGVWTERER